MSYAYEFTTRGSGDFIIDYAGENLARHKLVCRGNDDLWHLADADAVTTMPVLGITLEVIAAGDRGRILFRGYIADSAWSWTTGGISGFIYPSGTPGELTQTPPLNNAQVIATAFFATGIWFDSGGLGGGIAWLAQFFPAVDTTAYKGTYPTVPMIDLVDTDVWQTFMIPAGIVTIVRAALIIISNASGNIRWECSTNFGAVCINEGYQTHTDSIAATITAVTQNEIECVDISAALTGTLGNDLVGIKFTRTASHANDTISETVHYLGILIQGSV